MFHMMTYFNIDADRSIEEFEAALARFVVQMQGRGLVDSVGRIARRRRETIMDTDNQRNQEYCFMLSFRDRAQCDRAVQVIGSQQEPDGEIHRAAYSMVRDALFTCWEDI